MKPPDLDAWLADPALRVSHRRAAEVAPPDLWQAARGVRVGETGMLGRLVRWRIPGVHASARYDELFRSWPFTVLQEDDGVLLSGLVGRIWTLRRDYPRLSAPEDFRSWAAPGTVRVLFANWVEPSAHRAATLVSETRVGVVDGEGRTGLALVRPLVTAFHARIGSEAMAVAVRRAEAPRPRRAPAGARR